MTSPYGKRPVTQKSELDKEREIDELGIPFVEFIFRLIYPYNQIINPCKVTNCVYSMKTNRKSNLEQD